MPIYIKAYRFSGDCTTRRWTVTGCNSGWCGGTWSDGSSIRSCSYSCTAGEHGWTITSFASKRTVGIIARGSRRWPTGGVRRTVWGLWWAWSRWGTIWRAWRVWHAQQGGKRGVAAGFDANVDGWLSATKESWCALTNFRLILFCWEENKQKLSI